MGLFDWITGSKAAPKGISRQPAAVLRQAMLDINRDTAPFIIRDGADDGCDLVAEWKIVDARWYEIFAKASLTKAFKIRMKFDEAKGEVRSVDQEWTIEWRAGVPTMSVSASANRGQINEVSFGTAYAFKEDLSGYGQVYTYRFNTGELKAPLYEAAAKNGWAWKGVAFGRL